MRVYLAGGFHSEWKSQVIEAVADNDWDWATFYDPGKKENANKQTSREYTNWDLFHIKRADVLFAYIEKDNPSAGVLAEIGYAKGLGKMIILVIDPNHSIIKDRYFDFVRAMADVEYSFLSDGINYLKSLNVN